VPQWNCDVPLSGNWPLGWDWFPLASAITSQSNSKNLTFRMSAQPWQQTVKAKPAAFYLFYAPKYFNFTLYLSAYVQHLKLNSHFI
jgi:hypothetical protein